MEAQRDNVNNNSQENNSISYDDLKPIGLVIKELSLRLQEGIRKKRTKKEDIEKIYEIISRVVLLGPINLFDEKYTGFYTKEDEYKRYLPYFNNQGSSYPNEILYMQQKAYGVLRKFKNQSLERIRLGLEKRIDSALANNFKLDGADVNFRSSTLREKIKDLPEKRIYGLMLRALSRGVSYNQLGKKLVELFSNEVISEYEKSLEEYQKAKRAEEESKLIENMLKSVLGIN